MSKKQEKFTAAWRNRLPINDYLVKIIGEYMEAHPEWKETIDILNK